MEGVVRILDWAILQLKPPAKCRNHHRGDYLSMPCGYSFGGGQQEPMNFAMSKHNAAILDKVLGDPYMQRFARFMDRTFGSSIPPPALNSF